MCCLLQLLMKYWQPIPEVHLWYIDTNESHTLALFFLVAHWVLWLVILLQVLVYKPLNLLGFDQV